MLNILIVDDEPPARNRLRSIIETASLGRVSGEAGHGREAIRQCEDLQPDVILMDIRMPGMDGLEAASHISKLDSPPAIIFTTAYDEYALAAFKTHAIDYLLKPVRQQQLSDAINASTRLSQAQQRGLNALEAQQNQHATHISASLQGNIQLVPVENIFYFHAEHKYVTVYHTEGEVLIEESLKSLEERFSQIFLRVHRNALIARKFVTTLEKDGQGRFHVHLSGCDDRIEVSRRHLPDIRKFMKTVRCKQNHD